MDTESPPESNEADTPLAGGGKGTLEFLLRRMRHHKDFPALAESVEAINRIASSEKENVEKLSALLLRDFALTNKLLRVVNSPHFRRAGAGTISTVSRAVLVMGFDAVRNIALAVVLFDHVRDRPDADTLMQSCLLANLSGSLGRELAGDGRDREQAYICALFHHLGRLLTRFYFPEEADRIATECERSGCSEENAAIKVLGMPLHELGIGVARNWGFPPAIVDSMRPLPEGIVRKPANAGERMRALATLATELADTIGQTHGEAREKAIGMLRSRCARMLDLSNEAFEANMDSAVAETMDFARVVGLSLERTPLGRSLNQFSGQRSKVAMTAGSDAASEALEQARLPTADAAGSSRSEAQDILAAGIQEISNSLVEDFRLNDILRMILEVIYRAMGFERVVLCIRDPKQRTMQGRFGFGPDAAELARTFRIGLDFTPDIFHASLDKGADVLISDVGDPAIAARIPDWFRSATRARSFVLLPLVVRQRPVALIYAEKQTPNSIRISEHELTLLRTLRNQAVLAIRQSS
ncbi:HDOD domain-containing protein [Azoarcus taiwanensis]|uniref:HDOD domain-containing protein n=1 Tax=Azoarcus taiwanensis TaxID=666964 RepID=A0A972F8B6_9RHOO|nr:HDOD domain-containing protein [Azoarcus taiwanensis]NMG03896.1 HDOD domain-containing protein [Azoarcus taiwanensis]